MLRKRPMKPSEENMERQTLLTWRLDTKVMVTASTALDIRNARFSGPAESSALNGCLGNDATFAENAGVL